MSCFVIGLTCAVVGAVIGAILMAAGAAAKRMDERSYPEQ